MSQTEVQLIKDAVIVNADISNSAAIDVSKISGAMPLAGGSFTDDVTFTGASANIVFDKSDNALEFADNAKATFGTGGDLEITHDGTDSIITNSTGDLQITDTSDDITITAADDIRLRPQGGENGINVVGNGAVELYHDNSKKLETQSTGVTITGVCTATSFSGSGANLTDVDAGATGGGSDKIFYENGQTVTTNYTIGDTFGAACNAMAAGPITINSGVTVTVNSGETLTII